MGAGCRMSENCYTIQGDYLHDHTFPIGKGYASPDGSQPPMTQTDRDERIFGHKWASDSDAKKD